MLQRKTRAVFVLATALLTAVGVARANHTNTVANTTIDDVYVAHIEAQVAGNTTTFYDYAPFFGVRFEDANGNRPDMCGDLTGSQTVTFLYPTANNKDVVMSLIQMAYLNQKRVTVKTEAIVHGSTTLCFIKVIRLYK